MTGKLKVTVRVWIGEEKRTRQIVIDKSIDSLDVGYAIAESIRGICPRPKLCMAYAVEAEAETRDEAFDEDEDRLWGTLCDAAIAYKEWWEKHDAKKKR